MNSALSTGKISQGGQSSGFKDSLKINLKRIDIDTGNQAYGNLILPIDLDGVHLLGNNYDVLASNLSRINMSMPGD